jgi:hypothetical protein
MEGGVHGGETGSLDHGQALGAETCAIKQELRIAAAAGEVTDEMQTVHLFTPKNAKAQPAERGTRLRLPSAPTGAKQRFLIPFNSFKTS